GEPEERAGLAELVGQLRPTCPAIAAAEELPRDAARVEEHGVRGVEAKVPDGAVRGGVEGQALPGVAAVACAEEASLIARGTVARSDVDQVGVGGRGGGGPAVGPRERAA